MKVVPSTKDVLRDLSKNKNPETSLNPQRKVSVLKTLLKKL